MRATNHKHYRTDETAAKRSADAEKSVKARKAVKPLSFAIALAVAAAALIIPTTTLAPDVDAYEDSKTASFAVGGVDTFSNVIKSNCVEIVATSEAVSAAVTAEAVQETTEKVNTEAEAESENETETESSKTEEVSETESESQTEEISYDSEESSTYESSSASTVKTSSSSSSTTKKSSSSSSTTKKSSSSSGSKKKSSSSSSSSSGSGSSSSSSSSYSAYTGDVLLYIGNPDYSYSPSYVSLSSYDRAKLERLVMGEAGTMGFTGCALVAQSIRDAMNLSGTSSIDRIISEYQYFGSTSIEPNSDVLNAVSFIFDQNGSAVQHRVLCFYIGYSSWHETQTFITEYDGVRFFDLVYA